MNIINQKNCNSPVVTHTIFLALVAADAAAIVCGALCASQECVSNETKKKKIVHARRHNINFTLARLRRLCDLLLSIDQNIFHI